MSRQNESSHVLLIPECTQREGYLHTAGRLALVLSLLVLLCGIPAHAQTTSTIEGTVTDRQGLPIAGADVKLTRVMLATAGTTTTNSSGFYQLTAVAAGTYTLTVSHAGFSTRIFKDLEVTLNRTLNFDIRLEVGAVQEQVQVSAELPLLETQSSSQGSTIAPQQIVDMPINGRNYLDLMQLVPGVAINRQADAGSDNAVPVLGERGGNTNFLIDGLPNRNELNGGAAAQFNQETIAEFQVITTGYKAEFGHASGGVVNVITKSGNNDTHGVISAFHRNNAFDSSDVPGKDVPHLLRWDYSLAAGGALIRDKVFWFGSAEEIHESRQLNFVFPPSTPPVVRGQENSYNTPTSDRETRFFAKFDEVWGRHRFSEQVNFTNAHVGNFLPLSVSTNLPSTRTNLGSRSLLLGFSDTATLGDTASPWVMSLRGQYRREPSSVHPAHPEAGPATLFNMFSSYTTGDLFGDLGQIFFGSTLTPSNLDQMYVTLGASAAKTYGKHTWKFGWDFVRTRVDGVEANLVFNQLFATLNDYAKYGPINAGFFTLYTVGGATPQANEIHLRDNYDGLFVQDDWRITRKLTINLGVRWDYDSAFDAKHDFSPRLGFAWSLNPKTVVRGSWGLFYDHFRLGLARDIPGFGGADLRSVQPLSIPRLFYGNPSIGPALTGICLSPVLTDAEIAAAGLTCPYFPAPLYGVDHLNGLVASGHAPIPADAVVNVSNVQSLTGLTPQQFADQASLAISQQPGYFYWGPFGALSWYGFGQGGSYPVTVDPSFATPYSRGFTVGVQRQLTSDWAVTVDYYHKDIKNILGVRQTNLPFSARIPGNEYFGVFVNGYGPWYTGTYNAGILSFTKRLSHRFTLGGSYNFASENDNALCSNFDTSLTGVCYPTDSFRGITTVLTDPVSGKTNASGSFFASNGNWVPKAGIYYNGADLDKGPSDFALHHTFEAHGLVQLPLKIEISSLFRVQSGFRYTSCATVPVDQDGNLNYNCRDLKTARNQYQSPYFLNMDMRIAKTFPIRERVKIQVLFEFFNLFNSANPAAMQASEGVTTPPFRSVLQTLPGREGQIGIRIEF